VTIGEEINLQSPEAAKAAVRDLRRRANEGLATTTVVGSPSGAVEMSATTMSAMSSTEKRKPKRMEML
jgi:hypothetical protein